MGEGIMTTLRDKALELLTAWDRILTRRAIDTGYLNVDNIRDLTDCLREYMALVEKKDAALLLAARWFKLNFDDDTLNEHPPSKADLAGMFDAMQEARLSAKEGDAK
jgi:hypothetical protein